MIWTCFSWRHHWAIATAFTCVCGRIIRLKILCLIEQKGIYHLLFIHGCLREYQPRRPNSDAPRQDAAKGYINDDTSQNISNSLELRRRHQTSRIALCCCSWLNVSLLSGSLQLAYIDADGWKSNLSVIRPFGVMVYCGIYVLVLHSTLKAETDI